MASIRVNTNFNIDLEFEAAPFYKRLFAWLIDSVVLIIYILLADNIGDSFFSKSESAAAWYMFIFLPFLSYHLVSEILMKGQSLGKKVVRIKVVNENGGQPGIGQYVIRWLIRTSDYMVIVLVLFTPIALASGDIDYFWKVAIPFGLLITDVILVNSKKQQRLGDMLAHTMVINATEKQSIHDTVFLEVGHSYIPSFPKIMQLSDKHINALKGILDTARKKSDFDLAQMASEKIKRHLNIDTTLSPFDFLEVLMKDYNYLSTH